MIKDKSVVGINYVLTNAKGKELDKSDAKSPLVYLHGTQQIVPGLEKELASLNIGDKKNVVVSPEEGYGEVNTKLHIKTERSFFPKDADLKAGMEFSADTGEEKQQHFTIVKIEDDNVFLDGNHPLAGEILHFDVEVVSIRDATADELVHGHAHGEGGHHH